jgi:hypothetical protein
VAERRPSAFRQRDLSRAVRAMKAAGEKVERVEIDREGKIVIIIAREAAAEAETANEWDAVR